MGKFKPSFKFIFLFCSLFIGVAYLIYFAGFTSSTLNLWLLGVCGLVVIGQGLRLNLGIELPLGAFMAVLLVTTLFSIDPHRSVYQVWLWSCGFLVLYTSASLTRKVFPPLSLMDILLLVGAGMMLFSWLDAFRWYRTWLALYPGQWIPLISYRLNGGNTIAAYYHGLFALAVVRLWFSRRRAARFLWAGYSLSALLLLLLASSRGAYVGLIGAFGFLLLLRWRQVLVFVSQWLPSSRRIRLLLFGLAGAAVLVVIAGGAYWFFGIMSRHPTHGAAMTSRGVFWTPALQAFAASPLIGNGPDTYAGFYMAANSTPPGEIFLHAHNSYLDLLSGSGILGLLGFLWLVVAVIIKLTKGIDRAPKVHQMLRYAGLLALLTFLGHSLFDGLYRMPFASFNLCLLLGAALGAAARPPDSKKQRAAAQFAPLMLAALALGLGIWLSWSKSPYQTALRQAANGDLSRAADSFAQAARRDPWFTLPYQQRGLALAALAANGDPAALDSAIEAFEQAINLEPVYAPNHANLASLYHSAGRLDAAERELRQAAVLAPDWAPAWLNLGLVYEQQGALVEAQQAYQNALALQPGWVHDEFWLANPLRQTVQQNWLAAHPPDQADEALSESELLRASRPAPLLTLAQVRLAEGDQESARRLVAASTLMFANDPALPLEQDWLRAELAAATGDVQAAARLGTQTLSGWLDWGAYGPGGRGFSLYAGGIFHRSVMPMELVPQFTRIPLGGDWADRMAILAGWQAAAGDTAACRDTAARMQMLAPQFATTPMGMPNCSP